MKKFNKMKAAVVVALSVVLFSGCMKEGEVQEPTPVGGLSLFNAYVPAAKLNLRVNDKDLLSLNYSDGGAALWNIGEQKFSYLNAASNQVVINGKTVKIEENKHYSAFVYGLEADGEFLFTEDALLESTEAKPRVRFINLSNYTGSVDVFFNDTKITGFSDRFQENESSIIESKKYVLSENTGSTSIVIKEDTGEELAKFPNHDFKSNEYYTIYLYGNPDVEGEETNSKPLSIKVVRLQY